MLFLDLDAGTRIIRRFGALICDVIYTLISKVYELFMTVARLNILSSPQIQPIYQRVTMILTIVMVFYITFEFVKYTISPDTITDKEKGAGNILKRVIIVISLIALVPEIFTTAYKLQNRIIETQLISKVIIGTSNGDYANYGNDFSANTLGLFYYYDEDACSDANSGLINECADAKQVVAENLNHLRTTGDSGIVSGINLASGKATFKEVNPAIKFNGILAIAVGAFMLYILVMYSIDVGTRYAQLIFLQIISPIAIMGYILPKKDGIFQKWGKQCITTYIDLFLRIAIINFVLLIVKVLGDGFESGSIFTGLGDVSNSLKVFTYIVLVMGLLVFAQRAPKLLGELFPSSGAAGLGFGLSPKNRGFGTAGRILGTAAGTAIGAGAGLATGVAQGLRKRKSLDSSATAKQKNLAAIKGGLAGGVGGLIGGAGRGLVNGGKKGNVLKNSVAGAKKQIEANKKFGNREENGYSFKSQVEDVARNTLGLKSRTDLQEEIIAPAKRRQSMLEKVSKANDAMVSEADKQIEKGAGRYSGELASAKKALQNMTEDKDFSTKVKSQISNNSAIDLYEKEIKAKEYGNPNMSNEEKADFKLKLRQKMVEDGRMNSATSKYLEESETIDKMTDTNADEKELLKSEALDRITKEQVNIELGKAQQAVKKLTDKARFDFITNGKFIGLDSNGIPQYEANATINKIRSEFATEIHEYNEGELLSNQLDENMILEAMQNGAMMDALIKGQKYEENGIVRDYTKTDEDGYKIGINSQIEKTNKKVISATAEQERIKRETAGSGINEGKK